MSMYTCTCKYMYMYMYIHVTYKCTSTCTLYMYIQQSTIPLASWGDLGGICVHSLPYGEVDEACDDQHVLHLPRLLMNTIRKHVVYNLYDHEHAQDLNTRRVLANYTAWMRCVKTLSPSLPSLLSSPWLSWGCCRGLLGGPRR